MKRYLLGNGAYKAKTAATMRADPATTVATAELASLALLSPD
jgi:hypothetical protein